MNSDDKDRLVSLLTSRRFILLISGLIVLFSKELFEIEISEEQLTMTITLIASWILGDSIRRTEKPKGTQT
jgi:hypothetical protein